MKNPLGRKDFVVINVINRIPHPPYKELLVVKDFTGRYVDSWKIR